MCSNIVFDDLFRITFLNLINIEATDNQITALFFITASAVWLINIHCFISASIVFSIEIRDIVKNPFVAKTTNRINYFLCTLVYLILFTPLIMYASYGKKPYFIQPSPDTPLSQLDEISSMLFNIVLVYKSLEILLISNAIYVSYFGIWKREGVNKNVKTTIMMKQGFWIIFRVVIYVASYVPMAVCVYGTMHDDHESHV